MDDPNGRAPQGPVPRGQAGRGRWIALVMAVLLGAYLVLVAWRGIDFIRSGAAIAVVLGLAVLVFPLIGAWVLVREWTFGARTQELGRQLADRGLLPPDDIPRRPSGRPVRAAADERFAVARDRVAADPGSWEGWYLLAIAYDDSGDRRRARSAMRQAIEQHSGTARPTGS